MGSCQGPVQTILLIHPLGYARIEVPVTYGISGISPGTKEHVVLAVRLQIFLTTHDDLVFSLRTSWSQLLSCRNGPDQWITLGVLRTPAIGVRPQRRTYSCPSMARPQRRIVRIRVFTSRHHLYTASLRSFILLYREGMNQSIRELG